MKLSLHFQLLIFIPLIIITSLASQVKELHKVSNSQVSLIDISTYFVKTGDDVQNIISCFRECVRLAVRYSTLCAGITVGYGSKEMRTCHMLYSSAGDMRGLTSMTGADIIKTQETYLNQPQTEDTKVYFGFDTILNGTVNGISIMGDLINIDVLSDGYIGKGIYLNGVDQWVEFGSHQDRCFGNVIHCYRGFSFAFWVKFGSKPDDPDKCQFVFNCGDETRAGRYAICRRNGQLRIQVTTSTKKLTKFYEPVEQHKWFHLAITWSLEAGLSVLINGTLYSHTPIMNDADLLDPDPNWMVLLGKSARFPESMHMAEVTVDELYFWETWLRNVEIWKVYATAD